MTYNRPEPRITLRDEFTLDDFSGSLNQAAPPDKVPANDFLRFMNARVCDDAKSFERRPGTVKLHAFTKRVLGVYGINETDETRLLACLEDDIQLKSGGAWGSIFTPTKAATSPVQIAQHKGLTFIAGYEKPIMVRAGVGLYPGLEAPAQAPMVAAVSSGGEVLAESYPESNVDHLGELRQDAARTLIAQSFKATKTINISQVKLQLRKIGSPTGNIWVEIHSGTAGTSGTKNASTGILGQASDNVNLSTLTNAFASVTFTFSGTKPPLVVGSTYFIVVYGDFTVGPSAYALVGFDSSSSTYEDGKYYEVNGSMAWSGNADVDLVFEVNGPPGDLELIAKAGSEETGAGNVFRNSLARVVLAQSFTAEKGTRVYKALLSLSKVGSPSGSLWVEIHSRGDTTIRVKADAPDTIIQVVSTTGMVAGDRIGITLDEIDTPGETLDQTIHFSTISSVTDEDTVVINDAIPDGRWSSIDSEVFFQNPTSLTKNTSAEIVGLASDNLDVSGLQVFPETKNEIFYFTADEPILSAGKTYYIMLYGDFLISASNYARWSQIPVQAGLEAFKVNSSAAWSLSTPNPFRDYCYEVWGYEVADINAAKYPSSNLDTHNGLREAAAQTLLAQIFHANFDGDITKVQLYLSKFGLPTGNVWVEIHQSQAGTSGSKNSSTNQVGAASDDIDVSTLDAFPTFAVKTLTFSGTKPTLVKGTDYFIVVYGSFAVSATAFVKVGMDKDVPETYGPAFDIDSSYEWTSKFGASLVYYIWRAAGDIAGVYSYVVTFVRGGNYPCESNPSPASVDVTVVAGQSASLTGIPVSADESVTARNIYRTEAGMATHKLAFQIGDNTTTGEASPLTGVTGVAATDIFTKVGHGLVNGNLVVLRSLTGGAGLVVESPYYVIAAAADTFQLSLTSGGAAVDFTTDVTTASVVKLTVTDNADDAGLGDAVSYGNSPPPAGTTIETWDGRLWVAGVPGYDEIIFPSGLDTPEQFDITYNATCREREAGKVLKIMEFDNELWAFKAASIWKIARGGDSYMVDKIVEDVGLGAVGSASRCGKDMLIFLSNLKKIEILTPSGLAKTDVPVSSKVKTTLASINSAAIHKCVAGNYIERGEYRLAVPTGTNTEPDTVIVFNYLRGTFGLDTYNHNSTSMNLTDYSLGERALIQGSSSGSIYRVDEAAMTDDGAGITMDVQTGWFTTPTKVKIFRTFLDYILPESMTLSFRVYRNFKGTASYEKSLPGNTPIGLTPEIRDTIRARLGMALRGKAFSFRFINSEAAKLKVSRINCEIIHREKGGGAQAT